jgi:hypothetical protein
MKNRLPLIAALGTVLLLTACGPATAPTATPTVTGVPASLPPSPTPTSTPSPSSGAASTYPVGTCTEADMASLGPTPTIYTIYQFGTTVPVTFHYMAFNRDGTNPILTGTTSAPVTSIVAWPCTTIAGEQTWTFTATTPGADSVGCVLAFGGMLVQTDSKGGDDTPPFNITCSGNPGE